MASKESIAKIKAYLDDYAAKDPAFAAKYTPTDKSLDECMQFIIREVRNSHKNESSVMLTDEEVYGIAVHFYDEGGKLPAGTTPKAEVKANATPVKSPTTADPARLRKAQQELKNLATRPGDPEPPTAKPPRKSAKKPQQDNQASLFDGFFD